MEFENRTEAGKRLALELADLGLGSEGIVLALPRGGVPVAVPVARQLAWPLDLMIVGKLSVPSQEELAFGAVALDGTSVLNHQIVQYKQLKKPVMEQAKKEKLGVLVEKNRQYRGSRPAPLLENKKVILVDDGLATGATMKVALLLAQKQGAAQTIVAVPVGSSDACAELRPMADRLVCPFEPHPFYSVGAWYRDFTQVDDALVQDALRSCQE